MNLIVSGTLTPDIAGTFEPNGSYVSHVKYMLGAAYIEYENSINGWLLSDGVSATWTNPYSYDNPAGTYAPVNNAVGTATVAEEITLTISEPENGNIEPAETFTLSAGQNQEFTATPEAGYQVNQWLVDDVAVQEGGNSFTLVDVSNDHTISVTFTAISRHLCTLADVKTRLGITNTDSDDIVQQIIDGLDGLFDSNTNRKLLLADADVVEYYGLDPGLYRLLLRRYPVVEITSIKEASDYDFTAATALVSNTDYRLVNGGLNGIVLRTNAYWLWGEDVIAVTYRGGYCGAGQTPSEGEYALPVELRDAAIMQATFMYKRKDDIGLSSVSAQGGSISKFADIELLPLVKQVLDKYKRPSL